MKKRILCLVTTVCLLLTLFPVTAFAALKDYNNNNVNGIESGKTYCGDTCFTVDIPPLEKVYYKYEYEVGYYHVLYPDGNGRYKLDADLGKIIIRVQMMEDGFRMFFDFGEVTIKADHADIDKDHNCDNGCGKTVGIHEDADMNHICDYGCKEAIGICADADKDHKCDYGCGKTFGVCSGGTATCNKK